MMKTMGVISEFLKVAADDPRLGPVHICLYVVLVCLYVTQECDGALDVSARRIMPIAKIGGHVTYNRAIWQLHDCGYLIYRPSYNPDKPSTVLLRPFERD